MNLSTPTGFNRLEGDSLIQTVVLAAHRSCEVVGFNRLEGDSLIQTNSIVVRYSDGSFDWVSIALRAIL